MAAVFLQFHRLVLQASLAIVARLIAEMKGIP